MIPVANAPPAVIVFIIMFFILAYEKIGDILNIPPSKMIYARISLKEDRGDGKGMNKPLGFRYRVTFEIGNHQFKELIVPKKTYESVSVGNKGVLVHAGSRFRGFHVDKKIPDLIKTKKKSGKSNTGKLNNKRRKKSKGWR